jgi:predicted glycoside hydrolase/deacetylase ChbG (UPF0249 family)
MDGAIPLIRLLVNADDFGYSRGVNYGIVDAYKYGIVNSTTMLVNMPGTEHAMAIASENPDLKVGVHLTLTCGKAMASNVPSLIKADGSFRMTKDFEDFDQVEIEDVEKEWEKQIEHFLHFGLTPSHFDSHHHIHARPRLLPVVKRLSKKYNLPVRNVFTGSDTDFKVLTDVFLNDFFAENTRSDYFDGLENRVLDGRTVEVMCHPAYIDDALLNGSSYNLDRAKELKILTNTRLPIDIQLL